MRNVVTLLARTGLKRPDHLEKDDLIEGATWGDLENVLTKTALEPNRYMVRDIVTALWKESAQASTIQTLEDILLAAVMLADPQWAPGPAEGETMT